MNYNKNFTDEINLKSFDCNYVNYLYEFSKFNVVRSNNWEWE